jgi:ASC-1-like (ASCH) protein
MLCWSTIVDSKNKISSKSEKILLPDFYQNLIQKNEYLSDYVDEYLSKNLKTPYKYIATILKNRKPFIQTSVKTVIINYLIKNKYKLELDVQEPFLSFIKSGQKIVEGRLAKEKYLNLKKGDLIKINDVEVEVADIFKYKSFEEMIIKEGIKNVIPNANSLKGAVNVYYKFYSKEDENLFGVVAIKLRVIR